MFTALLMLNLLIAITCIILIDVKQLHAVSFKSKLLVFVITNIPIVNIFLVAFLLLN